MEDKIKQVIVMRTDLNMRKGKMIVQGSHASMKFLTDKYRDYLESLESCFEDDEDINFHTYVSGREEEWIQGDFIKICVKAKSLEELLAIKVEAERRGIKTYLIEDNGATEFHGVKTPTCLALGPDFSSILDPVTRHLELL